MSSWPPFIEFIDYVRAGRDLTRDEMRCAFEQIMEGKVAHDLLAEFLLALTAKGESVDEIAGAADVMNEKVIRVPCERECADTCGTGGDGINTFNVSTTAAIIAAAAGAIVAKHGNHTSTRVSGSADVMQHLGVSFSGDVKVLERCLSECGLVFLHAPLLHPAMKHAAPVRRQLGVRTIFNLLGPLTNPAGARRQVIGTCKPELTEKLGLVLAARNAPHAWVPCSREGLCDLSITGPTQVTEVRGGEVSTFTVHPEDMGLRSAPLEALLVNSPAESAAVVMAILEGKDKGPRRDHALLNAAALAMVAGLADELKTALQMCADALDRGDALSKLQNLISLSKTAN